MDEQVLIGVTVALLCGLGLWHDRWLLSGTRKGQRLVGWFGEQRGLWVLRVLLVSGALFGLLLATDVIRPVRW
jgi:hypothetical protein